MTKLLDIVFINPPGYKGIPRRGPYELGSLSNILLNEGYYTTLLDVQSLVGTHRVSFPENFEDEFSELIQSFKAKIYFITLRTTAAPWVQVMAKRIRTLFPDSSIIFFAPRIEALIHRLMFTADYFDILCKTRGEETISRLVKALLGTNRTKALAKVPNIYYKNEEGHIQASVSQRVNKTNIALAEETIWYSPDNTMAAIHIGRGCPHKCTFCSVGLVSTGDIMFHESDDILKMADSAFSNIQNKAFPFVMLENESFLSNKPLVQKFLNGYKAGQYNFHWGCYGRVDEIDETLLKALKETNLKFLFMGIESGSQHMQEVINKKLVIKDIVPKVTELTSSDIIVHCTFIFGFPGETQDEVMETLSLMYNIMKKGGIVDINPLRIEPNTEMEAASKMLGVSLLPNTELYKDLEDAGFDPAAFPYEVGYRMYGINNSAYNLNAMSIKIDAFQFLLKNFPVASAIIIDNLTQLNPFIESLSVFAKGNQFITPNQSELLSFFEGYAEALDSDDKEIFNALIKIELSALYPGDCQKQKAEYSETDIFYPLVKSNMDLLYSFFPYFLSLRQS